MCKLCSVWFTSQTATLIHSENFCQSFNIATTRRSHIQQQMREPNMHQAMCVNTQKYQCIHGYQHRRHSKLTLHPNTVSTGKKKPARKRLCAHKKKWNPRLICLAKTKMGITNKKTFPVTNRWIRCHNYNKDQRNKGSKNGWKWVQTNIIRTPLELLRAGIYSLITCTSRYWKMSSGCWKAQLNNLKCIKYWW